MPTRSKGRHHLVPPAEASAAAGEGPMGMLACCYFHQSSRACGLCTGGCGKALCGYCFDALGGSCPGCQAEVRAKARRGDIRCLIVRLGLPTLASLLLFQVCGTKRDGLAITLGLGYGMVAFMWGKFTIGRVWRPKGSTSLIDGIGSVWVQLPLAFILLAWNILILELFCVVGLVSAPVEIALCVRRLAKPSLH